MYCTPERQIALLRIILVLYRKSRDLIQEGVPLARIRSLGCVPQMLRAKSAFGNTDMEKLAELRQRVVNEIDALAQEYVKQAS